MRISDWSSDVCSSDLFWEPVRLADVSMKPWCFVNLGGMKLDPGFDIGFRSIWGPSAVGGASQYYSSWHVHWYAYPLIYWMEIVADFLCLESRSEERRGGKEWGSKCSTRWSTSH